MSSLSSAVGFVPKTVMLAGLAGILTGLVISSLNQDSLGWSLLRTSALGVFFALAARHLLYQSLRAWLETKMELVTKKAEDAAKGQAAKAGVPAQTK